MKIAHVSDLHGKFIEIPQDIDLIIDSGDSLPNKTRGNVDIEPKYQRNWIGHHKEHYKKMIGDKKFLTLFGNHNYLGLGDELFHLGFNSKSIDNSLYEFGGLTIYGFSYIPYIQGEWINERTENQIFQELTKMEKRVQDSGKDLDILVSHAPPKGVLDYYTDHWGSQALREWLDTAEIKLPRYILSGHIHSAFGYQQVNGVHIYNSATICQTIEIT